jgi:hypothetical protein
MEETIRCCVSLFIVVNDTFPRADLVEPSNRGRRSGGRREERVVKNGGTENKKQDSTKGRQNIKTKC